MAKGETWLAVDREGRVGRFRPGLEGTVPRRALAPARRERLAEAIDLACVVRLLREPAREPLRPDVLSSDRLLVVLRDDAREPSPAGYRDRAVGTDPIEQQLARFSPRVLREEAPRILVTRDEVDVPALIALLREERVLHALAMRDVRAIAASLGASHPCFTYAHLDERHERASTYARVMSGAGTALHESEIPEPERTALCALRVPVSFNDAREIEVEGLVADELPKDLLEAPSADAEPGPAPVAGRPVWAAWIGMVLVMAVVRALLRALFDF
ncbi:hypothetical protein [Sandaracinus amylolyticus]|uniref:hypothetical protein n=1 Tax=Sandaracinus amylolyticus TaxID=927083 RepID=UPI001F40FFEE|nr:hypothetical protein [Sandaracinus amylolyticus]